MNAGDEARQRKRNGPQNETDQQRRDRLDKKNERRRLQKETEAPEQKRAKLNIANEQQRRRRAQKQVENEATAEAKRKDERDRVARARRSLNKAELFRSNSTNAQNDENKILEHNLGKMNVICMYCKSLNFEEEKTGDSKKNEFTRCCQKGQVKLPAYSLYPEYLKLLLTNKLPESANFMKCIRSYNSSFAFASTGANIKPPPGNGPYSFRVCGQIVHRTGTIHPLDDSQRKFSQLYILDPEEAANHRMMLTENKECNLLLMTKIGEIMNNNPWVKTVKMLKEVEEEAIADAERQGIPPSEVMLAIIQDKKSDPRRYNAPTVNEVAVIFQSADGEPPFDRDIIVHMRPDPNNPSRNFKRINILNQNLDALTYPILFPNGDTGWNVEIKRVKKNDEQARERVSIREYCSYRLSERLEFCPIFYGGKVFQQIIVDWFVRAEANDLKYIRDNQPKLRAEKYSGLMEHGNANDGERHPLGKAVILPSSFQGSPRNMQQHFQDAMAIVTKFGKPDLFVTMTCNPKWIEITENLKPGQAVEHRPDLVARVFNLKLKNLLDDICSKDKSLFGKVIAKVHVVEFQKRGLPHAHILIILDKNEKLKTPEDIDRIVKAEIPDPVTSPRLYEIVTKNMIHNPCGKNNEKSRCMVSGKDGKIKCSKGFPKDWQEKTDADVDGYARYQRRDNGKFLVGGHEIDNSWVVPYNPYLSLRYNCHINVEVCASIKSVKYLFKYVYKGHDCANLSVQESNGRDEIKEHVDGRYVGAPEAIWRIFCIKMHDQSHTIYRLPVHIEDEQMVYFQEGNEVAATERAASRDSKLTAWFKLNEIDPDARQYRYWEIPIHYVWNDKNTKWTKRQRGGDKVIGRMYGVSFKDQERYYLRILLTHEKGATSFVDLKTFTDDNGDMNTFNTFQEAAKAKGYILDETVWQETLDDAKIFQMPYQMRQLFAYICALGGQVDALKLWNENKDDMIEDYCHKLHDGSGVCRNCEMYALPDIKDALIILNKDYALYHLPEITVNLPDLNSLVYNLADETTKANEMINSLNVEQLRAFNEILDAVNDPTLRAKCYFLDGPGGSGKTYTYTAFLHYFRSRNEIVLATASTGIAATLLIGGRTFHSQFKLIVPIVETSVSKIELNSRDAQIIKDAKLIIIDECTMASSHALNTIDILCKEIMGMDKDKGISFGGKVVLLGGDFRQCLNIVPHAKRAGIVQSSIKYAKSWEDGDFKKLSLISNMRSEDPMYSEWLLRLGNGALQNDDGLGEDVIEIPSEYICEDSLVKEIYGDRISEDMIPLISKRAILCPKNKDVDKINEEIIALLDGESRTYTSDDFVITEDESVRINFPVEFLNTIELSGIPSHKLTLKNGTIVLLMRNLNTKRGLCNGTRLVVREMNEHVIKADVLTSSGIGESVLLPRIDLTTSETDLPFQMRRRQFPIKPAFAMTINKSQGQTLEKVGILLPEPVFSHGHLYVAFSRVRRACDVKVQICETSEQGRLIEGSDKMFTKNVVYREVFE